MKELKIECYKEFSLEFLVTFSLENRAGKIPATLFAGKIPDTFFAGIFGIGEMKTLQTLSKIVIGGENDFSVNQLKDLNNLRGEISFKGLDKVLNIMEARAASLSLNRITVLKVEWDDESDDGSREQIARKEVLDALKPYEDTLKELVIVNYLGLGWEVWSISNSRSGVGDSVFPCLKRLDIEGCPNLFEFSFKRDEVFPCLQELCIRDSPNLVEVSLKAPLLSLRDLTVSKCGDGLLRSLVHAEGSIAEGYVAEEALTFSSHYFRDVTTKFNRLDRNVDPNLPTCQFQVFRSVCKSIGLRSVIRFDAQELKKVKWHVLHNSPEIDTLFPNKYMKEEFPDWFGSQIRQRHVDNDKDSEVSTTSELFALACGPTWTPISINSYVVNGVRYVVHSRNARRITQNSGICSLALTEKCTMVSFKKSSSLIEDDPDIIHFDNSSDLLLSTSLNDLDNATLHIDGQSTEVDVPPDIIIDVVDEDDDITDEEDALPHDLAESDNEDLNNVDDDDVARSHGDDGRGEDRPLHTMYPAVAWVALLTEPNLHGRASGRLNTRDKNRNLSLKEITDTKGPVPIQFEPRNKQTVMPLGDHVAHCSSYIGEVIWGVPLYYPSWLKVPKERKVALITDIE
nr:hypothetical protein [Tanacetum cinerariifolium]